MKIASISSSSAKNYYYEQDPIFNKKQEGNNLEWHGKLSEHFELKGAEVAPEEFANLLEGKDPQGNQLLNRAANTTNGSENAVFDAPLSAPKSISILALNHDSRLIEAHDKAVRATIEKLESDYAKVRGFGRQEDGSSQRVSRDSNNLLIASAKHSVSRDTEGNTPDPSLHSHVLVFNMSFDQKDNKFKALDASDLFKDQRLIDQVYKSELAKEVTNLGYAIEHKAYGNFDIKMDQDIIDNFSKRHMEIKGTMQERGLESIKDEVYIQHTLKSQKREYDSVDLKKNWSDQLKGLDIEGAKSFEEIANGAKSTERGFEFKNEKEALERAASLLSENEAKFSKKELLLSSSKISLGQFSINDLEKELNNVNKTGQTYGAAIKKVDDKTFTTQSMHMTERNNIKILKNQVHSEAIMSDKVAQVMLDKYEEQKGFSLTHGQRNATQEFLTSKSQFIAIQGNSGVGKTTMLEALKMANEEYGNKVSIEVLAPTGKAALEAKEASGLKASTIDSFLMKKSEDSTKNKIYVVDETSMLDTKKANQLLKRAESEGSRVFFMGDSKQLSSVGAGDFFNQLKQNTQTVEVTQSLRQKNDIQKEIVSAASKKDMLKAFEILDKKAGGLKEVTDKDKMIETVVAKASGDYKNTIIMASTKKEVTAINQGMRAKLGIKNELTTKVDIKQNMNPVKQATASNYEKGMKLTTFKGAKGLRRGESYTVESIDNETNKLSLTYTNKEGEAKQVHVDTKQIAGKITVSKEEERSFGIGDKVLMTKNDKKVGVMNGQVGIVKSIDKEVMKVDFGEKQIDINTREYKSLDHGFGVTIHASQGATEKKAILLADSENNSMNNYNSAYVAMSRQKEELTVVTDNKDQLLLQVSQEQQNSTTIVVKDTQPEQDKFQEITDNLNSHFGMESSQVDTKNHEKGFGDLDKLEKNIEESKSLENNSHEIEKENEFTR